MPFEKNKNYSPFSKEFYMYKKGMSEEDAIIEAKSKRPCNKEYWIKKGYSEEEAIQKVSEHQKKSGKKFSEKLKKDKNIRLTSTQKEYWIKKGYSEEEAVRKVSERQTTFSKEICMEKYGKEEGLKRLKQRQKKWQETINSKTEEDIMDINKRKGITLNRMIEKWGKKEGKKKYEKWLTDVTSFNNFYSKESNLFFGEIYKFIKENYKIKEEDIFYAEKNKEYFLFDDETNIYFYDFTIKNKLIIEYHGEKFHPNTESNNKEDLKKWKQLFTGKSYETVYNRDMFKKNLAMENGYKFIEVFSNDENKKDKVLKFIKENL